MHLPEHGHSPGMPLQSKHLIIEVDGSLVHISPVATQLQFASYEKCVLMIKIKDRYEENVSLLISDLSLPH